MTLAASRVFFDRTQIQFETSNMPLICPCFLHSQTSELNPQVNSKIIRGFPIQGRSQDVLLLHFLHLLCWLHGSYLPLSFGNVREQSANNPNYIVDCHFLPGVGGLRKHDPPMSQCKLS